jgi:hypothetical protein
MKKFSWSSRKGTATKPEWTKDSENTFNTIEEAFNDMKTAWMDTILSVVDGSKSLSLRSTISPKRLGAYIDGANYSFFIKEIETDDDKK